VDEEVAQMVTDEMPWDQWDHEAIRRAGRAETQEAGREVARLAHALELLEGYLRK